MPMYEWIALRPPLPPNSHLSRALTLSFVLAAAALSMLSIVTFWCLGDLAAGVADCGEDDASEDDATLVEGGGESGCRTARRRLQLGALFMGTTTRLLLGGLGTAAMVRVVGDRPTMKHGSFIAVEVLGWLLV